MQPVGYLCQQHSIRLDRPVKAYDKWVNRIPNVYREFVLNEEIATDIKQADDPYCLATIKHYRSLMPMAMEARKPMFDLTSADGAIGAHQTNVQRCHDDFEALCREIARRVGRQP